MKSKGTDFDKGMGTKEFLTLIPPYEPRSRGRESAPYFLARSQRRLTSAATVPGFKARSSFSENSPSDSSVPHSLVKPKSEINVSK